jgi:hypothetical protein
LLRYGSGHGIVYQSESFRPDNLYQELSKPAR